MKFFLDFKADNDSIYKCKDITGLDIAESIDDAEVVLIKGSLNHGKNTRIIQCLFAGTDFLDLSKVPPGITVLNNAGGYNEPVAETVFALILSHLKNICSHNADMHNAVFKKRKVDILYRKKIGIIGFGGIGKQVSKIALAFGMDVFAFTRRRTIEPGITTIPNLMDLAMNVDIAVICVPLTGETRGMINEAFLSKFGGNIIVNIARADIVDQDSMLRFLSENPSKSYLSDVWWNEPEIKVKPPANCMVTPHIGGMGDAFRNESFERACYSIRKYLDGSKSNVVLQG